MENIWSRFDSIVTDNEVNEAKETTFEKPTEGQHTVELLAIEPSETQQGSPIVKVKFKDVDNSKLIMYSMFLTNMNYPDQTPKAIVKVMNFITSLTGEEMTFVSMANLAEDISNVELGGEYIIDVHYKTPDSKYPDISVIKRNSMGDEPF